MLKSFLICVSKESGFWLGCDATHVLAAVSWKNEINTFFLSSVTDCSRNWAIRSLERIRRRFDANPPNLSPVLMTNMWLACIS